MKEIICGIYQILNTVNGKSYIGQSINIEKRWTSHINELNRGQHSNSYLQNAWNQYGENNFTFLILEQCDIELLDQKEIYYISALNTTNEATGYNLTSGGNGNKKVSSQTVQKMLASRWTTEKREENSERVLGVNNPMFEKYGLMNSESKPVLCINTGQIFESMKLAAKWCGLKSSPMIGQVCTGKRKSAGKHPISGEKLIWKFVNETDKYDSSPRSGVHLSEETKQKLRVANLGKPSSNKILKSVYCVELDRTFESPSDVGKILGLRSSNIILCCQGIRHTCGGYHWKYADEITNHCESNELAM